MSVFLLGDLRGLLPETGVQFASSSTGDGVTFMATDGLISLVGS